MSDHYLLDTNICIYIRRKKPEEVLRRFRTLRRGEASISVITYGELLYGAAKSIHKNLALEQLRQLVRLLPALALPEAAAEAYAAVRTELEGQGESIGNNCFTCLVRRVDPRDHNEKAFQRVRGLRVQNWVEPNS